MLGTSADKKNCCSD